MLPELVAQAGSRIIVLAFERVFGKLRQVRIVDVGDPEGRLFADIVGHIAMGGVLPDRWRAVRQRRPFAADRDPPGIVGGPAGASKLAPSDPYVQMCELSHA